MGLILAQFLKCFCSHTVKLWLALLTLTCTFNNFLLYLHFLQCINFILKIDDVTFVLLNFSFLKLFKNNSSFDKQRKSLDCYFTLLGDCPLLLKLLNIHTKWQILTLKSNISTQWIDCWGCPRNTGQTNLSEPTYFKLLFKKNRKQERKKLISTRSILKKKYSILNLFPNPFCKRTLKSCF